MFGSRRLAKRSIVGTQVCAVWPEDGRYYPGVIKSTTEWPDGQEVYNVQFDQQKTTKIFQVGQWAFHVMSVDLKIVRHFYVIIVNSVG